MKIRIELPFVHGCVRTEMFSQGVELQRLVPDMLNFCNDHGPREIRARVPSGIQITFRTDSRFVRLPFTYGPTARQVYDFDVFRDGAPVDFTAGNGMIEVQLDGGEHTILILPPHLVQCWFGELEIEDGASVSPVEKPQRTILFLGDSIMQGMTVSRPSLCYAFRLAKRKNSSFFNLSVGGMTAMKELGPFAMLYPWDEIFIALGTNDFAQNKPLEQYLDGMDVILRSVIPRGNPVTVITPPYLLSIKETNASGIKFPVFRAALEQMVREKHPQVHLIDGTTLLPYDEQYYIDQIHPNDPGEDLFFRNLTAQLGV